MRSKKLGALWLLLILAAAPMFFGPATGLAQARGRGAKRPRDVSSFRKQYSEGRQKFNAALLELARVCQEDKDLPEAAARIRRLAVPLDSSELRLAPLPRDVQPPLRADLPADERFWRAQLRHLQQ